MRTLINNICFAVSRACWLSFTPGVGRQEAECKENADTLMQLRSNNVRLSTNPSQCQEPGTSAPFAIGSPLKIQCYPLHATAMLLHIRIGFENQEAGTVTERSLGHLVKRHLFQSLPLTSYCGCPKLKNTADLNKRI